MFLVGAAIGFVWTFVAWRNDERYGCDPARVPLLAGWTAGFFGFVSGVVRNSRTFHPDGRVFRGTVRSLNPSDGSLARAAQQLEGSLFMRIGMGVMKRGMPAWLADHIPDAPSIASRFYGADAGDTIPLERRLRQDLDLLCTAGGDRLWKLLVNLALGGQMYGLKQFDYFDNVYYADVPYRIDDGKLAKETLDAEKDNIYASANNVGAGAGQGHVCLSEDRGKGRNPG